MEDACIFFSVGEAARTSVDCKQRQGSVERTKEEKLKGDSEALRYLEQGWKNVALFCSCSRRGGKSALVCKACSAHSCRSL